MNKPFDQRIINQLERPTSSDLNIAQSQLNSNQRALLQYLLQTPEGTTQGAVGNSFKVYAPFPNDMTVRLAPGLISTNLITDEYLNIGTITGLNDVYPQRTILLSAVKSVTVPAAPGAGLCRRDVIAVRPLLATEMLTDTETTDIYNPSISAFGAQSVSKTLTSDLAGQVVQVINYNETPTAPIVYIKGQESTYSALFPDLLLSAPAPLLLAASGYTNIAIINVRQQVTSIAASDIVDYRRIAAPAGNLTLTGKATIGWAGTPGGVLSDVVIKAPAGVRASIYKAGANAGTGDETNTYVLAVFGARNVSSADISITPGIPGPEALTFSAWTIRPTQLMTGAITLSASSTYAAQQNYADSDKAAPTQDVAIGQPVHFFPFTLGTVESIVSTGTSSITVNVDGSSPGDITIPVDPAAPYPGGTYIVANANRRGPALYGQRTAVPYDPQLLSNTFYLDWGIPGADVTLYGPAPAGSWIGVLGFLTPAGWMSGKEYATGVWNISFYAAGSNDEDPVVPPVVGKLRVYKYDGTTLTGLYTTGDVAFINGNANRLSEVVFSVPITDTLAPTDQFYFYIEVKGAATGVSTYYLAWGNEHFVSVQSPLLLPEPTITVPDPSSNYPAATYTVDNAVPGQVTVVVPTTSVSVAQKFNPKTRVFQYSNFDEYHTVPITFTVNLTMN